MNYCIAETIRRLLAPRHELSCSWLVWNRLITDLRERGRERTRESGAFLLGYKDDGRTRIIDYVLYDDLDPACLDTGIVRFNGRYFSDLWAICEKRGLDVVADVHVHPVGEGQSESDMAYPMISQAGHVALILPRFATAPLSARHVGIYRYLGGKQWSPVPRSLRSTFLHIGI